MIQLSNGHCFQFIAASGALAFDGRGWPWEWPLRWLGLLDPRCFTIVLKTLTRWPRRGNVRWYHPFRAVRFLRGGTVNTVGLTNPGIDRWCKTVGPRLTELGYSLIASITSDDEDELLQMETRLNGFPLVGLEFNASCPNTKSELMQNSEQVVAFCRLLKRNSRHPLLLKLSVTHDYGAIAKATEGVVEAISINSVPWPVVFPDRPSPLARFGGGGVSGKIAQPHTWRMLSSLKQVTQTPLIGASVWDYEDIAKLFNLGASAVAFGSIFLRAPWRPTRYVWRFLKEQGAA